MAKKNNNRSTSGNTRGPVKRSVISAPATSGTIVKITPQEMRRILPTTRGIRVRNTEQIDYLTSQNIANTYTNIKVGGNFTLFPWIAGLAARYSYFRVHRLRVHLLSNCPSTQRGDVILAWCPDTLDASAWVTASNPTYIYSFSKVVSGPAWSGNSQGLVLDIGPQDSFLHSTNPWKRIGTSATNDGQNQIYAGAILWQTGSNQSGGIQAVGNLFVEYDIEFVESTNNSVNSFLKGTPGSLEDRETGTAPDTRYPKPPVSPSPKPVVDEDLDVPTV